jgi:hypothetical protein
MRTLEAAAPVNATDPLPECLIEATIRRAILAQRRRSNPRHNSGVGLADDAILVQRVVARHGRELVRDSHSHATSKGGQ